MDKLTALSGILFFTADIFAIGSLANPDWIVTSEAGMSPLYGENKKIHCPYEKKEVWKHFEMKNAVKNYRIYYTMYLV